MHREPDKGRHASFSMDLTVRNLLKAQETLD